MAREVGLYFDCKMTANFNRSGTVGESHPVHTRHRPPVKSRSAIYAAKLDNLSHISKIPRLKK